MFELNESMRIKSMEFSIQPVVQVVPVFVRWRQNKGRHVPEKLKFVGHARQLWTAENFQMTSNQLGFVAEKVEEPKGPPRNLVVRRKMWGAEKG